MKPLFSSRIMGPVLIVAAFLAGFFLGYKFRGNTGPAAGAAVQTGPTPPALSIPADQPTVGFLNKVDGKAEITVRAGGQVEVSGWAACSNAASPLSKVQILVDKQPKATATLSLPRPDVAAAYGRPDFAQSGWKASVDAQDITVGSHQITAQATCAQGESGVLPPFQLVVSQ
jgi:hypothetical protein